MKSSGGAGSVAEPAIGADVALSGVVRVLAGRLVLDGLELTVSAGERLGIVGRSGSGKSRLLSLVAGS